MATLKEWNGTEWRPVSEAVFARRGSTVTHNLYVDAANGDDTRSGATAGLAVRTLARVAELIDTYDVTTLPTAPIVVNLVGTFTTGHTFKGLDKHTGGVTFQGQPLVGGVPVTKIQRTGSSSGSIGLGFDPVTSASVTVKNIAFEGWQVGFNGYGVLMKGGGALTVDYCTATNCDTGFAAIRNVSHSVTNSTAAGCTTGFVSQYSSSGSFNYCTATSCQRGYFVTRNSVNHIDYSTATDCTVAGVSIDMASRVAVVQAHFKRNAYGVKVEGAGEWLNDGCSFYGGTADANTVAYAHFGAGRENRLHAQASTAEFRTYTNTATYTTAAGVEEVMVALGSNAPVPAYFLTEPPKRLRAVICGELTGSAIKSFGLYRTNTSGAGQSSVGHVSTDAAGAFTLEVTLYALTATTQRAFLNLTVGGTSQASGRVTTLVQEKALNTAEEWRLRVLGNSGNTSSSVKVSAIDVYISG